MKYTWLAGAVGALLGVSTAQAVPITGGVTEVELDDDVAALIVGTLGVSVAPLGSATFDSSDLVFGFPITGGDLSAEVIPGSTIAHEGSGIGFSAGAVELEIGDFLIDTTTLGITGFARSSEGLDVTGVPLFTLGLNSDPDDDGDERPFTVSLTDTAAGALNATFDVDAFGPIPIGTANTSPVVDEEPVAVAEPGVLGLLAAAGLAFAVRRRRA